MEGRDEYIYYLNMGRGKDISISRAEMNPETETTHMLSKTMKKTITNKEKERKDILTLPEPCNRLLLPPPLTHPP